MSGREEKEKEEDRREVIRIALISNSIPSTAGASTLAYSGDNKLKYNVVGFFSRWQENLSRLSGGGR